MFFPVCRSFAAILFSLLLTVAVHARPHPGVDYVKLEAAGVPIHLVNVDLSRTDIVLRPVIAPSGHRYPLKTFVQKHRPLAAINGTFFDTLTGITVGNLVSNGRLLSEGMAGSNLVFHKSGAVELISSARNLGRYQDWADVDFAVGGGPTLIANGEYFMDPRSEGFRDPSLFHPRPRTAIGVTSDGKLRMVVVTHNVTLWTLAHIMADLGCVQAMNLDGGSSSGLSVGGQTVVNPRRTLTNLIGVFPVGRDADLSRAVGVASTRALEHYQKGLQLLDGGRLLEARSHMRQAVAKAPGVAAYWRAAGQSEERMNNPTRAILDLVRAAELFFIEGDLVSAEDAARTILGLDGDNLFAHLVCGESMIEQGLDTEAVPHLEAVLRAEPDNARAKELMEDVDFRARSQQALNESSQSIQGVWSLLSRDGTGPYANARTTASSGVGFL